MLNQDRLKVLKTYKIYIGGKFPRTESGRYTLFKSKDGKDLANICNCSRKDFREAVTSARGAFDKWATATHYNRGQILYRIAEMLEDRRAQFVEELILQGETKQDAEKEVNLAVDRLVYYAGWSDKYQQVFSAVNPVSSKHFNFSILEPMGVIGVIAPEESGLLGLVSVLAPAIVGGNTVVMLASESKPLTAVTFAEVLNSSDVPGGVVNILTGSRKELLSHYGSHMDVNALVYSDLSSDEVKALEEACASNVKRTVNWKKMDWFAEKAQGPYHILNLQEVKTTWHPISGGVGGSGSY